MINRRSQQSKGLVGVYLALVLAGCTAINIHQEPPRDWPELKVIVHPPSFTETQRACGISIVRALLVSPAAGCAVVNFQTMTCEVFLVGDDPYVLEHELSHCKGYDHYGSTHLRDLWENWKRGQITASQ